MSQNLGPLVLVPNTPQIVNIPNANAAAFLKVTNGTPYDLSFSGFGTKGASVIPAGTEYLLHAEILNIGSIYLDAVNNVNSSITSAIVNIVAFYDDEEPPRGTWPITVPTQVVNTAVTTANFLTNTNTAAGSNIIDIEPVGDPSPTYTVDNSGNVTIGTAAHQGTWTKGTGLNQVNIDTTGTLTVQNRIVANLIKTITGNDFVIDVETGHKIALQINNTDVVQVTATSVKLLSGVSSTLIANLVKGDAASDIKLDADTGQKVVVAINTVEIAHFNVAGTSLDSGTMTTDGAGNIVTSGGKYGVAASGDTIDASTSTAAYFKTRAAGTVNIQNPNGTTVATFTNANNSTGFSQASTLNLGGDLKLGTASTTNNLYFPDGSKIASYHGISGSSGVATNHNCPKQPQFYTAVPNPLSNSPTTICVTAITATQITVNTGSGTGWIGYATTFN